MVSCERGRNGTSLWDYWTVFFSPWSSTNKTLLSVSLPIQEYFLFQLFRDSNPLSTVHGPPEPVVLGVWNFYSLDFSVESIDSSWQWTTTPSPYESWSRKVLNGFNGGLLPFYPRRPMHVTSKNSSRNCLDRRVDVWDRELPLRGDKRSWWNGRSIGLLTWLRDL